MYFIGHVSNLFQRLIVINNIGNSLEATFKELFEYFSILGPIN